MTPNGNKWIKLDNAAKIFPPTSTKGDPKVFRFSCELFEDIQPNFLEISLEKTLLVFPFYKTVLRRGLFWYYFDTTKLTPKVEKENLPPCAQLYHRNYKTLLFRVSYYRKRINVEVYHALSDGTGALEFLKTLVSYYLKLVHKDELTGNEIDNISHSSISEKMDDSFLKYYKSNENNNPPSIKKKNAFHIKGPKFPQNKIIVIVGIMETDKLLRISKSYNTTLSIFLTALFLSSISECMSVYEKRKPVVITVPVNLRNYFKSQTARNFFGVIEIGYNFSTESGTIEDIIANVKKDFARELAIERISKRMNTISKVEHNIFAKIAPLSLKDVSLYLANEIARGKITAAFSNIGKIEMPIEFRKYINYFDVFTSTDRLQICMCSYYNKLSIAFTSPFMDVEVQRHFFTKLSAMGLEIEISSNPL